MVGAGGRHAPIHNHRALHGCRGDRTAGRDSRSRYIGLSGKVGGVPVLAGSVLVFAVAAQSPLEIEHSSLMTTGSTVTPGTGSARRWKERFGKKAPLRRQACFAAHSFFGSSLSSALAEAARWTGVICAETRPTTAASTAASSVKPSPGSSRSDSGKRTPSRGTSS